MPKLKSLFAAITKIDAAKRTITGIAMQEVVDRTNEKCLYDESKPFFEAWSENQSKASGGKSKGNLRVMHGSKVAGRVTELDCDDTIKAFVVTAAIDADDEWKLVESGAYTGFSIGANFARDSQGKARKSMVDGVLEWVADPVELSLVDTPCVPTALFELKSADGSVSLRKFVHGTRQKSMYSVSQMASALADLRYLVAELEWEKEYENDDSQIPPRLREWIGEGAEIFLDLAEEETSEFAQMITEQKAARADRVKAGSCSCGCDACSNCTKKKAATPAGDSDMTAEQTKAFNEGVEAMKAAAATIETLKSVPETLKTITETQKTQGETITGFDDRLKAVEEIGKSMEALAEAFGEQPQTPKTKSAVAVERSKDVGTGAAGEGGAAAAADDLPKDGDDLTNKPKEKRAAFKALYAQGGEENVMQSTR